MFRENSFGLVTPPTKTTMTTNVWLWKHGWTGNKNRGNFEWVGADFYADGGLWFDDNEILVDYDGIYDLPPACIQFLYDNGHLCERDIKMWSDSGRLVTNEEVYKGQASSNNEADTSRQQEE
mgnify:CR=1 FL=1